MGVSMNDHEQPPSNLPSLPSRPDLPHEGPVQVELVPVEVVEVPRPSPRRRWRLPLVLFLATCASTYAVGGGVYSLCVMTILVCHEAGHFIQAWRYGVYASFPYFLPMPLPPIGTLGAVIAMDSRVKNRRALFDIGITGPLAGLVPTLIFCVVGLQPQFSRLARPEPGAWEFGEPLVFKFLVPRILEPVPEGLEVQVGPMAMAGWVGLLITALNLFPIGQLDGGHILYSLLRRRAHPVATMLLAAAVVGAVVFRLTGWSVMLLLLILMGPKHPPTSDDTVRLGAGRILLGWLTLAFLPLGFTPNPIILPEGLDWQGPPPEEKPFRPPPSDDQRWVWQGSEPDRREFVGRTERSEARRKVIMDSAGVASLRPPYVPGLWGGLPTYPCAGAG